MKTTKTFSIEAEVYSQARAKHKNLSEAIERLLRADLEGDSGEKTEQELSEEVKRQESIIASLRADLSRSQDNEKKTKHNFDYVEDA
ncbi:hypothetical protein DRH27_04215 [Candidatus Falkowbacteria bacterium]|nr:MAG: hypothetical protein DRH27_04215 [Candidatus Falkowbacteria bacterium]